LEDVLEMPEDPRHRIELVGGALLMSPNPGLAHQGASYRLHVLLEAAIQAAGVPLDVREAVNVIVPDGLLIPDVVVADAMAIRKGGLALHAHEVAVVIEIASPSTRVSDKRLKPSLYATAGIPHYWRVELEPVPRIYLGQLELGGYVERMVQSGETTVLTEPFPFDLDPASLSQG
jgi:Uma2 family endonuclease